MRGRITQWQAMDKETAKDLANSRSAVTSLHATLCDPRDLCGKNTARLGRKVAP